MNLLTLINEAFKNLISNKVRSFLTMLGIFIGVAAVIAMMAIGLGAKKSMSKEFEAFGTNKLFLYPYNMTQTVRNSKPLTDSDAKAIRGLSCIDKVAPSLTNNANVSYEGEAFPSSQIIGAVPDLQTINSLHIEKGRFISQEDEDSYATVAVVGSNLAKKIFPDNTAEIVGQYIRINSQPYLIIGLLKGKGMGYSQEDQGILIPFSTLRFRLMPKGRTGLEQIQLTFKSGFTPKEVEEQIKKLMIERHEIASGAPEDFSVYNMQATIDSVNSSMMIFVIFLAGVAAISLLVGGIGIMNIMMVTVTERTREIGLRKALGAKQRDIQLQFLVESSVLSLIGGMIGIIFGQLLAMGIAAIATSMGKSMTAVVNIPIMLGSALFSIIIGLFFGIYPANRAAKLEPVIALRSE